MKLNSVNLRDVTVTIKKVLDRIKVTLYDSSGDEKGITGNPVTVTAVGSGGGTPTADVNVHDGSANAIGSTSGSLDVAVKESALPTGASTAANQATSNTHLTNLNNKQSAGNTLLTSLDGKDFATSAKQDTNTSKLTDIETNQTDGSQKTQLTDGSNDVGVIDDRLKVHCCPTNSGLFIEDFESAVGFVGSADVTNIATSSTHVEPGDFSLSFDKSGTTQNIGEVIKTINVNVSDFENSGFLEIYYYLPSIANVAFIQVDIGTDSSNYDTNLFFTPAVGWNKKRWTVSETTASIGNGANYSALVWMRLRVQFLITANTLNGILFDNFSYRRAEPVYLTDATNRGYEATAKITDGTNDMPTGDAAARRVYVGDATDHDATTLQNFGHGTVAIGYVADTSTGVANSSGTDRLIKSLSLDAFTDPGAEIRANGPIPVRVVVQINSTNVFKTTLSIPNNCTLNVDLDWDNSDTLRTIVYNGGLTALNFQTTFTYREKV